MDSNQFDHAFKRHSAMPPNDSHLPIFPPLPDDRASPDPDSEVDFVIGEDDFLPAPSEIELESIDDMIIRNRTELEKHQKDGQGRQDKRLGKIFTGTLPSSPPLLSVVGTIGPAATSKVSLSDTINSDGLAAINEEPELFPLPDIPSMEMDSAMSTPATTPKYSLFPRQGSMIGAYPHRKALSIPNLPERRSSLMPPVLTAFEDTHSDYGDNDEINPSTKPDRTVRASNSEDTAVGSINHPKNTITKTISNSSSSPLRDQKDQPPTTPRASSSSNYDEKPTCSLTLVCYRAGTRAATHTIVTAQKSRFTSEGDFLRAVSKRSHLVSSDQEFFDALRAAYRKKLCGFWRRYLSLKTLRRIQILAYSPDSRPWLVPLDDLVLQEILVAYKNPSHVQTDDAWIKWVFSLRMHDRRHALDFVEGWSGARIALAGSVPWVAATAVGVTWAMLTGDVQTAFTVAVFVLFVATLLIGLLAIVSGVET